MGLEVFELELFVEGVHELLPEILGFVDVLFAEADPDLDPEVEHQGRVEPRRYEPDPVDHFSFAVALPQEVEHQPLVDLLVVLVLAVDLEHEPAALGVLGVLPGGRDPIAEVVNRVDPPYLPVDLVAE